MKQKAIVLSWTQKLSKRERFPRAGKKSWRPTHFHSKETCKNTKLISIIYTQRLAVYPYRSCACCFSLYELVCTLLNWFRGVFHHLWLLQSLCFLFHGIPWALRKDLIKDFHFRLSPHNVWLWVSALVPIYCVGSLMMTQWATHLWV